MEILPRNLSSVILSLALLGAWLAIPAETPATAATRATWTIEVSEAGFNPAVCLLSRGDQVFFKNVGSAPRHIVGTFSNGELFYDSGEIAPGTVSANGFSGFDFPNHWLFSDVANPSIHGVAITPTNSNTQDPDCLPDPALRPPPGAAPHDCATAASCVHAAALAKDG